MALRLQIATLGDLPFIVEVYNSIISGGEVTADIEPVTEEEWLPSFKEHTEQKPMFILYSDEQRCGWMSFSSFYNRPAWDVTLEISIYLAEQHRKKGLGAKFLSMGMDEIARRGALNLLALIYRKNIPSIRLFEKAGFSTWGNLPGVCELHGELKDVVLLGKHLPGWKMDIVI